MRVWHILRLVILGAALGPGLATSTGLDSLRQQMGVNIHFITPPAGALANIAKSGVGWIRMDFKWHVTETVKGKYDFSMYEALLNGLDRAGLRALFILDYGNPLYERGAVPRTISTRAAFAAWAAAAVSHFRDRGIIWEIWNEPNMPGFWQPKPSAEEYMALLEETVVKIRKVAPGEILIGPAAARIDSAYLESCFRLGLLRHVDAVSVHPYRWGAPESVEQEYQYLARLIREHSPEGRSRPIIASEWGYSTQRRWVSEADQARFLVRMRLLSIAQGIPLSIWYDWINDGSDFENNEHNFGMVRSGPSAQGTYEVKDAYRAQATLSSFLRGKTFRRSVPVRPGVHILAFSQGKDTSFAAWSTEASPQPVQLVASGACYRTLSFLGHVSDTVRTAAYRLSFVPSKDPLFLESCQENSSSHPRRSRLRLKLKRL